MKTNLGARNMISNNKYPLLPPPSSFLLPLLLLLFCLFFLSCNKTETSRTEFVLGTVCTVTLFDQGSDKVYKEVFSRLREIDNLMSVHLPASDISRINAAAGIESVQVNEDVFSVIVSSIISSITDGAFDPTIGPIVNLWGINSDNPRVPSQEEIEKVLPLINWRNVELDKDTLSVFLTQRGMALDLGAIAKGYAADEAAIIIIEAGISRAIIDLGGNIVIVGEKEDNTPWKVGIQNPHRERGVSMGTAQVTKDDFYIDSKTSYVSIVTSGVYERFFEKDGKRYHHIFSPTDGYPADNDLLSVTIISPYSELADAMSTAIFVMGYEKGIELIKKINQDIPVLEVIFIFNDNTVRVTDGVDFTVTDEAFRVAN